MVLNLISHRRNQPCKGKKDAIQRKVCKAQTLEGQKDWSVRCMESEEGSYEI